MLDLSPLLDRSQSFAQFATNVTKDDLYTSTNAVIERMVALVQAADDPDITFVPEDPEANDPGAATEEQHVGWTAGHIVAHTTAGGEEGAAHALDLARGIEPQGRSRNEVSWHEIDSVAKAVQRIQESRRMRLAMLDAWPDEPHMETTQTIVPQLGPMNATARYLLGLVHEFGHLEQLRDALEQARAARSQD